MRWNFIKAYPVKWIGPQFWADGRTAWLVGTPGDGAHHGLVPRVKPCIARCSNRVRRQRDFARLMTNRHPLLCRAPAGVRLPAALGWFTGRGAATWWSRALDAGLADRRGCRRGGGAPRSDQRSGGPGAGTTDASVQSAGCRRGDCSGVRGSPARWRVARWRDLPVMCPRPYRPSCQQGATSRSQREWLQTRSTLGVSRRPREPARRRPPRAPLPEGSHQVSANHISASASMRTLLAPTRARLRRSRAAGVLVRRAAVSDRHRAPEPVRRARCWHSRRAGPFRRARRHAPPRGCARALRGHRSAARWPAGHRARPVRPRARQHPAGPPTPLDPRDTCGGQAESRTGTGAEPFASSRRWPAPPLRKNERRRASRPHRSQSRSVARVGRLRPHPSAPSARARRVRTTPLPPSSISGASGSIRRRCSPRNRRARLPHRRMARATSRPSRRGGGDRGRTGSGRPSGTTNLMLA